MDQLSQTQTRSSLFKNHWNLHVATNVRQGFSLNLLAQGNKQLGPEAQKALENFLLEPALEIKVRPGRNFRSQLVELGYTLAGAAGGGGQDQRNLDLCAESIECLHLGSLIVDDIQDGSKVRRNGQALHCMLGTPHALAVGNWLYFYAMRILNQLQLSQQQHKFLYEVYLQMVEQAHYGQIMDLCVKVNEVPYSHVEALCHDCMRCKTASIVMLALVLGAIVGQADALQMSKIERLGYDIGIYLQRLNDLGNFAGSFDSEKKWEDLLAWKPSFVWAFVIKEYGPVAFQGLAKAVQQLPDESALEDWTQSWKLLDDAKSYTEKGYDQALREFKVSAQMSGSDLRPLNKLRERIQKAYG